MTKPSEPPPHVGSTMGDVGDLPRQLLDCLQTPEDRRSEAAFWLQHAFLNALDQYRFNTGEPKRTIARKELAILGEKAAAFRAELDKLDDLAKVWLGVQAYRREVYGRCDGADYDDARRLQLNDLMLMGGLEEGRLRFERLRGAVEAGRQTAMTHSRD